MKAIVYTRYGSPDVLELRDIEKPTPKDNEVLINIHAAGANPADWHLMRADPFLARLQNGLFKPKNSRLGADVAGRVEAVGNRVTEFQIGDEVFGEVPLDQLGSFAEYVCEGRVLGVETSKPLLRGSRSRSVSGVHRLTRLAR